MARVFSAVDIQDDKVLDELERVRDQLDLGFNPVKQEKMHVTLQFFEDIDREEIRKLKQAMEDIETERFNAKTKGIGAFPSRDHIRVLWAGFEDEKNFHRLYSEASDHDVESSNDHAFKPHITLARVKNVSPQRKRKLRKMLEEFQEHRFGELTVNEFTLFESSLGPNGSNYKELKTVKL